jgi:hypothetical protein
MISQKVVKEAIVARARLLCAGDLVENFFGVSFEYTARRS